MTLHRCPVCGYEREVAAKKSTEWHKCPKLPVAKAGKYQQLDRVTDVR